MGARRVIAEFVTNGRQAFLDPDEILVEQLIIRFIDTAEEIGRAHV